MTPQMMASTVLILAGQHRKALELELKKLWESNQSLRFPDDKQWMVLGYELLLAYLCLARLTAYQAIEDPELPGAHAKEVLQLLQNWPDKEAPTIKELFSDAQTVLQADAYYLSFPVDADEKTRLSLFSELGVDLDNPLLLFAARLTKRICETLGEIMQDVLFSIAAYIVTCTRAKGACDIFMEKTRPSLE